MSHETFITDDNYPGNMPEDFKPLTDKELHGEPKGEVRASKLIQSVWRHWRSEMNDIQPGSYLAHYRETHPKLVFDPCSICHRNPVEAEGICGECYWEGADLCRCGLPAECGPYCSDCQDEIDERNGKYEPR